MKSIVRPTGAAAIAVVAALGLAAGGSVAMTTPTDPTAPGHDSSAHTTEPVAADIDPVVFHQAMRALWVDHVTWTRLYIVSAVAELPDLDATAGRLLQNQDDIGAAVGSFYGDAAGVALAELLREHILVAADLVEAAKAGDGDVVATQSDRWYANADEIATFLASANPAWPFEAVREMMRTHLDQTVTEVTARLTEDWDADIAAYDEIRLHILAMADVLATGIIEQFPDRFSA